MDKVVVVEHVMNCPRGAGERFCLSVRSREAVAVSSLELKSMWLKVRAGGQIVAVSSLVKRLSEILIARMWVVAAFWIV